MLRCVGFVLSHFRPLGRDYLHQIRHRHSRFAHTNSCCFRLRMLASGRPVPCTADYDTGGFTQYARFSDLVSTKQQFPNANFGSPSPIQKNAATNPYISNLIREPFSHRSDHLNSPSRNRHTGNASTATRAHNRYTPAEELCLAMHAQRVQACGVPGHLGGNELLFPQINLPGTTPHVSIWIDCLFNHTAMRPRVPRPSPMAPTASMSMPGRRRITIPSRRWYPIRKRGKPL